MLNKATGIFLRESTLFVNEPVKIYHNTAQDGGGIYAYSSRVEFQPLVPMVDAYGYPLLPNKQSEIAHNIAKNNGGGIYAVSTTIDLRLYLTSTLTQTQLTLVEVECIYSRAPNCIYLKNINLLSSFLLLDGLVYRLQIKVTQLRAEAMSG